MTDNKIVLKILKQEGNDVKKVKKMLLNCGCNGGKFDPAKILGVYDDWGVGLECINNECQKTWFLCCKCPSKNKMVTKRQVYDHWRKYHKETGHGKICKNITESLSFHVETEMDIPTMQEVYQATSQSMLMDVDDDDTNFLMAEDEDDLDQNQDIFDIVTIDWEKDIENKGFGFISESNNDKYFQYVHNTDGHLGGLQFLVKQCLIQKYLKPTEFASMKMDLKEMKLQMMIAKLLFLISTNE
jgi:hypothetical protein